MSCFAAILPNFTIAIWNETNDGYQVQGVLAGHTKEVLCVAFNDINTSSTGKLLLASGGSDMTACIWDVAAQDEIVTWKHVSGVGGICFHHADSDIVFTRQTNGSIIKYNWVTKSSLLSFGRSYPLYECSIYLMPASDTVIVAGATRLLPEIKAWNITTGDERCCLNLTDGISCFAASPTEETVAGGCGNNIVVWDIAAGRLKHELDLHQSEVRCVCYNVDGSKLVSGSENKEIIIWSALEGYRSLQSFSIGARPWSLCITPGDSRILCACDTSGIKIIDTSDGSICFRDKKACRQLKFWGGSNVVLL
jgi:WD40 repeat protein